MLSTTTIAIFFCNKNNISNTCNCFCMAGTAGELSTCYSLFSLIWCGQDVIYFYWNILSGDESLDILWVFSWKQQTRLSQQDVEMVYVCWWWQQLSMTQYPDVSRTQYPDVSTMTQYLDMSTMTHYSHIIFPTQILKC